MGQMDKISIVCINYNDKLRVKRAIDSALNQTHKDVEVIVVDDGSDEATRKLYEPYSGMIKLVQLERDDDTARTPSRARNAGIKEAQGEYICFLDSDNYYAPGFVAELHKLSKDVAFCNWQIVGKQDYKVNIERVWDFNKISSQENMGVLENYLKHTHLDHQCLLIKKSYLDTVGHYDERLPRSQDCDLIVRLILGGGFWAFTPKNLFTFEKHEDDQMKTVASIHGKALWSLKNNVNINWLSNMAMQSPYYLLSLVQAIEDFKTKPEWAEEYNKSDFKKFIEHHSQVLSGEISEQS
jgi:glycosyltransferase involved in cell wall biosynthesis